jgi:hypothetical protein
MPSSRRPAPNINILAGSGAAVTGLLTNVNLAVTVSVFPEIDIHHAAVSERDVAAGGTITVAGLRSTR